MIRGRTARAGYFPQIVKLDLGHGPRFAGSPRSVQACQFATVRPAHTPSQCGSWAGRRMSLYGSSHCLPAAPHARMGMARPTCWPCSGRPRELSKLFFRPASIAGKASPSCAQSLDRERRAARGVRREWDSPSPRGREARRACASHSNLLDNAAAALAAFELPIQMATAFGAATPFQPQNVRCAWTQSHAVTPDSSRDRSGKLRYTPITALSSGRPRRSLTIPVP